MALRRRNNRTRYLDERETRQRVALDNSHRAGRTEPHNRRRAALGTVGDPEIDGRLGSGSTPTLPNVEGDLPQEKLPAVPKPKLPGDTQYGRPSSGDLEYKDKSVPKRALEGVGWDQVDDKPSLTTRGELSAAEDRMRRYVKNYAQPKRKGN